MAEVSGAPATPKIMRRYLGTQLRKLRTAAGKTRDDAVARIDARSPATITAHEQGTTLPKAAELELLLQLYGAPERTEMLRTVLQAIRRGKDWWVPFGTAVPKWFDLFLGLESAAVSVESYDAALVPGLFQIPAYTEALIRAQKPHRAEEEIAQRVELRRARQELLHRTPTPPKVWRVLDEAALYRGAGGPAVLRDQLAHLLEVAALPHVDLQILPFAVGPHPGSDGTFTVLTFSSELIPGDVVYTDGLLQGRYHEDVDEVAVFTEALNRLRVLAASQTESSGIIRQRIDALTKEIP